MIPRLIQGSGTVMCLFAITATAAAQDRVPPGLVARFDLTQRLEYSDNPDFEENGASDFFGRTLLGFGIDSTTPVQDFSLDFGAEIEEGLEGQSSLDVDNRFVTLSYTRDVSQAAFDLGLRYRATDVSSAVSDDLFSLDPNAIDQRRGTRQNAGFNLGLTVGRKSPLGARVDLGYDEISYRGTNDPDLEDQNTAQISGRLDFRIDQTRTISLTARYQDFQTEGTGVDRETTGVGLAFGEDVNPRLRADATLSYDRIERSGGEIGTDDGLSATLDLNRDLTNGTIGLSFATDVASNDDGRRSRLSLNRNMEFASGASLEASLGLTGEGLTGTDPLINLSYQHELPRSVMRLDLSQSVSSDSDNIEQISTALRASYSHEINSLSSYEFGVSLQDRNELGATADDGQRLDLSLSYRHALTRDWDLIGSYTRARSSSDNTATRTANTVFIGVQRSFTWHP